MNRLVRTAEVATLVAALAVTQEACSSKQPFDPYKHLGARACGPYFPASNLSADQLEGKMVVIPGKSNANPNQAGGSEYRVIVEFDDTVDSDGKDVTEGVAFVDPGGNVKAAQLTMKAQTASTGLTWA